MSRGFTENELIATLLAGYRSAAPLLGPGDDAGMLAVPDGRLVTTVDTITEDQDFRRVWPCGYRTTGYDVGWKSVAQNLSDINAMGARPTGIVTSLSLPADINLDWVESFAAGVSDSIEQLGAHDCAIIGGDVGRGREISVTTTAFGSLDGGEPVLRSGARPGDILAVCGMLGLAAAGVDVLDQVLPESEDSDLDLGEFPPIWSESVGSAVLGQLRPRPRIGAGAAARASDARAMLDVSDGLVRDAERMAEASGVSIWLESGLLEQELIDLGDIGILTESNPWGWILAGGESFALLAAFGSEDELPGAWCKVGHVGSRGPGVQIDRSRAVDWMYDKTGSPTGGWDPFTR